ncbi:hypothetical protein [Allocoleopsis franciscana]|uniref:hypothetical protein n=1 Tax=Allocoleopsis franciscana TaxID=2886352 RepID=UPI0002E29789|nr:hypothetical protein [Allocoleopsis franciscana]
MGNDGLLAIARCMRSPVQVGTTQRFTVQAKRINRNGDTFRTEDGETRSYRLSLAFPIYFFVG